MSKPRRGGRPVVARTPWLSNKRHQMRVRASAPKVLGSHSSGIFWLSRLNSGSKVRADGQFGGWGGLCSEGEEKSS